MSYRVEFKPSAVKDLANLPKSVQKRIAAKIDALAANPRPSGVQQLSASEHLFRIRSGDYRIINQIQDKVLVVLVVKIGHRREIYRSL